MWQKVECFLYMKDNQQNKNKNTSCNFVKGEKWLRFNPF